MNHVLKSARGAVSPWFLLALLAVAVLIGWAIGRMDTPPSRSSSSTEVATGDQSEWTTYDAAVAESRRTGKPIMLDFNAEWCGPCQMLKRQVFDDHDRGAVVRSLVVPVSITDRTREEGHNPPQIDELQQRYQVDAFPTLVVFSPATGRVQQTKGFGYGDATLGWLKEAVKAVK